MKADGIIETLWQEKKAVVLKSDDDDCTAVFSRKGGFPSPVQEKIKGLILKCVKIPL